MTPLFADYQPLPWWAVLVMLLPIWGPIAAAGAIVGLVDLGRWIERRKR